MNKTELIEAIAQATELSKSGAARAWDAVVDVITDALKRGDKVQILGFGTFLVRERASRTGRNPKTGEAIKIAASKLPAFKAGKDLKESIQEV